ncbi:TetR/AcrR family transcriptional regulator [Phenylobacterium sp.]|uniref:TetR/AcrR family transcriptional regulator n=1 Tax=Phenylobacterium sp. TaxID=1871053 RepID=UPI0025E694FD|nr:TetR/AcrR family transcriptional regulator [Phenylobacterium sp.]
MSVAHSSKREDRRETILDVARDCFLAEGFAATSMSTIAARLGGSKGTLYNYFKSKEDLFAAMMQRQCGDLQETLFDIGPDAGDVQARLTHFARSFLAHLMTPEAVGIQRLVVSESERFPELGRVFYESGPKIVLARIGAYLEELMDAGLLRRTDPLIAAQHFKDIAISGIYWPRMWGIAADPTPAEVDEQVARAVDTFLRAYKP